ncbi:MAG TPA: MarR family winged helix-turn-helix transcriptional regulator [Alphaproteobacteria bacterium]|nr:MarR family winged helix-turn-helix transcriptional regulator [Alphaproteobacteria bacterium]
MKSAYLESIALIERLHRRFLDVVRAELERLGIQDINNVQGLILFNVGADEYTVGELTQRGYYLGTNVTYNLKKLVEYGYVMQARSAHDRRSVRIRLTEKGIKLRHAIDAAYDRHVEVLAGSGNGPKNLDEINAAMRALERFWTELLVGGTPLGLPRGEKAA